MSRHFDVVIAGGGLAGWSAALTLQKAGRRVLVVDRASFPRDKVCGGFLGVENQSFLQEHGIWDELKRQGAKEISAIHLASSSGADVIWRKPGAELAGLGCSRRTLDEAFRCAALAKGIVFEDRTWIKQSVQHNVGWDIQLENREHHHQSLVTARHLVCSWGAPGIQHTDDRDLIGAYALFEGASVLKDEVGLYFADGGHAGVNPFESGQINVCYVVSRKMFEREGSSLSRLFDYFKESNPSFRKVFVAAKAVSPWKAVMVPYCPAFRFFENGMFYAGDSAAVVHPVIGGGMTLAIDGGHLLGRLLAQGDHMTEPQIAEVYQKTFMKLFALRIQSSWWLGWMAHRKTIADTILSAGAVGHHFLETMFRFNHAGATLSTGRV